VFPRGYTESGIIDNICYFGFGVIYVDILPVQILYHPSPGDILSWQVIYPHMSLQNQNKNFIKFPCRVKTIKKIIAVSNETSK
jgi:hypothetical protein